MMTLSTLPPELLLVITSHLDYESEINALAQVSRNLYCILDPILYQINARNSTSHALNWAATHGLESTATKALEAGTEPTPETLCLAITHDHENMVRLLLDKGVRPNEQTDDESFTTPFATAAAWGRASIVRMLIDNGVTPNFPSGDCHRTPLALAAKAGHCGIVQLLVEAGCDVDWPNTQGETFKDTPLMLAARNGHTDVVQFLLERGADPNRKGYSYTSALSAASGHMDTVRCLLKNGAIPTFDLLRTSFWRSSVDIVELFLRHMQQPDAAKITTGATLDTLTLITICSAWNLTPQLSTLLTTLSESSSSDVNTMVTALFIGRPRPSLITTPLTLAAERNHLPAVRLLLDYGANPNGTPTQTDTLTEAIQEGRILNRTKRPLAVAIHTGNEALLRTLLFHGADPTLTDDSADPLLFLCLQHETKGEEMFTLLLQAGADYRASDMHGNPLWSAVIHHGTAYELNLLLNRGVQIPLHLFQTLDPVDEHGKFEEDWDEASNKATLLYLLAQNTHKHNHNHNHTETILSTLVRIGFNPIPNPNIPVYEQQTCHALFTAVIHGNLALLQFLLQRGFIPKPHFPWSAALLRAAADNQDKPLAEGMVDLLLSTGVGVDMLNCWGCTPLLLSLCREKYWGDCYAVEILLARGSDPLFVSGEGECALTVAAKYGNVDAVRMLIREIDARGVPFADFEGRLSRAVEVAMAVGEGRGDVLKILRREYWRRRYPVSLA